MKHIIIYAVIAALFFGCSGNSDKGWTPLFDGKTTNGWRGACKETFPDHGWLINDDGTLEVLPKDEGGGGGDIITPDQFDNFEIVFDFKLSEGANSGLKYYVTENEYGKGAVGLEYQILDDEVHPDAKLGKDGNRTLASLYDLMPPAKDKPFNGIGQWNTGRVVADKNRIEHWLNDVKVLEYERGSAEYKNMVAESKYKNMQNFGEAPKGHVLLQDHGDRVWFRNIKIRKL